MDAVPPASHLISHETVAVHRISQGRATQVVAAPGTAERFSSLDAAVAHATEASRGAAIGALAITRDASGSGYAVGPVLARHARYWGPEVTPRWDFEEAVPLHLEHGMQFWGRPAPGVPDTTHLGFYGWQHTSAAPGLIGLVDGNERLHVARGSLQPGLPDPLPA